MVDTLMCSSWNDPNDDLHIETRADAIEFCTGLLSNEFFIALKLKSKKKKGDAGKYSVMFFKSYSKSSFVLDTCLRFSACTIML